MSPSLNNILLGGTFINSNFSKREYIIFGLLSLNKKCCFKLCFTLSNCLFVNFFFIDIILDSKAIEYLLSRIKLFPVEIFISFLFVISLLLLLVSSYEISGFVLFPITMFPICLLFY